MPIHASTPNSPMSSASTLLLDCLMRAAWAPPVRDLSRIGVQLLLDREDGGVRVLLDSPKADLAVQFAARVPADLALRLAQECLQPALPVLAQ